MPPQQSDGLLDVGFQRKRSARMDFRVLRGVSPHSAESAARACKPATHDANVKNSCPPAGPGARRGRPLVLAPARRQAPATHQESAVAEARTQRIVVKRAVLVLREQQIWCSCRNSVTKVAGSSSIVVTVKA
jgi:hypothetical protein